MDVLINKNLLFNLIKLVVSVGTLLLGGLLALHHPVWPAVAVSAFYLAFVLAVWKPHLWLFLTPALLPVLNFSPWTGWLIVDEFDLLILAMIAGTYGNWFWCSRSAAAPLFEARKQWPISKPIEWLLSAHGLKVTVVVALLAATLVGAYRGFGLAGGFELFDGSLTSLLGQSYADPMNGWRVAKSCLWGVLFVPLIVQLNRLPKGSDPFVRYWVTGMLTGLSVVCAVAVWERGAFPGWFNFSTAFRTTALFWEMHVGGAAIDVYLALAVPFLAYALVCTKRRASWALLAMLAILTCYTVLTSFSRSVYVATILPLLVLAVASWIRQTTSSSAAVTDSWFKRRISWRGKAGAMLAALLVSEVVLVVAGGSFLRDRLADAESDFDSRIAHWQRGIDLLTQPAEWFLGLGLGRLPAQYAKAGEAGSKGEFSGSVQPIWLSPQERANDNPALGVKPRLIHSVVLKGPATGPDVGAFFGLTQAVPWKPRERYWVTLQLRAASVVHVLVKVCEKHLIYEGNCHARNFRLPPTAKTPTGWQTVRIVLQPDMPFRADNPLNPSAVFSIAVVDAGNKVELRELRLFNAANQELTQNGDFSAGMARWFPSAGGYYLPWHIDNLYL